MKFPQFSPSLWLGVFSVTCALLSTAVTALYTPPALAHAEHGHGEPQPEISKQFKAPKGMQISVAQGKAFQFLLATDSSLNIQILDEDGRPFYKIEGAAVWADVNSTAWHRARQPGGGAIPPHMKDQPPLEPKWLEVSQDGGLGWYDARLLDEEVQRFNLNLVVDGKKLAVPIAKVEPAAITGFWRPRVAQVSQAEEHLQAMIPGLSGQAIMLQRVGDSTVEVLDENGAPFIKLNDEGAWLAHEHPWAAQTGLFFAAPSQAERWVKVADGQILTYSDPRIVTPAKAKRSSKPAWVIPLRLNEQQADGKILGEMVWQKVD